MIAVSCIMPRALSQLPVLLLVSTTALACGAPSDASELAGSLKRGKQAPSVKLDTSRARAPTNQKPNNALVGEEGLKAGDALIGEEGLKAGNALVGEEGSKPTRR